MLIQTGRVISVDMENAELEVGFESAKACAACAAGEGCGLGIFAGLLNRRMQSLRLDLDEADAGAAVHAPTQFNAGDTVRVAVPESWLLMAALWVYGLPLLLGLAGAALGAGMTGFWPGMQPNSDPWLTDLLIAVPAIAGVALAVVFQRQIQPLRSSEARLLSDPETAPAVAGCRIRR